MKKILWFIGYEKIFQGIIPWKGFWAVKSVGRKNAYRLAGQFCNKELLGVLKEEIFPGLSHDNKNIYAGMDRKKIFLSFWTNIYE